MGRLFPSEPRRQLQQISGSFPDQREMKGLARNVCLRQGQISSALVSVSPAQGNGQSQCQSSGGLCTAELAFHRKLTHGQSPSG